MNNNFCKLLILLSASALFAMPIVYKAHAAGLKISQIPVGPEPPNKHNLSVFNTGVKYRALADVAGDTRGKQICIFCHTPHNANVVGQAPLWNRKFSDETAFQRYSSDTLKIRGITAALYGEGAQPNGSSRLCLSCHDGVSKLGALFTGNEISLAANTNVGDQSVIEGTASFKTDTNKMKAGHHPVSFVYTDAIATAINNLKVGGATMYTMPTITEVKLDKQSRMQCTTCHNAHQNMSNDTECYGGTCDDVTFTRKIAPFWVYGDNGVASTDQQDVCLTCHPMDGTAGFVYNTATPWTP